MKKLVAILVLCLTFVFCAIGFTACSISNSGNTDDKGTKTEQGTNNSGNNDSDSNKDDDKTPQTIYYTITFNANGGSNVSSLTIEKDGKVTKPKDPTKEGYNFVGWYKDSTLTKEWNFSTDKVTADTVLYAKWELVTIENNDDTNTNTETDTQSGETTSENNSETDTPAEQDNNTTPSDTNTETDKQDENDEIVGTYYFERITYGDETFNVGDENSPYTKTSFVINLSSNGNVTMTGDNTDVELNGTYNKNGEAYTFIFDGVPEKGTISNGVMVIEFESISEIGYITLFLKKDNENVNESTQEPVEPTDPSEPAVHQHSYINEVCNPTCTENGYTLHKCSCGDEYMDQESKALGHDYINNVCTRCGKIERENTEGLKFKLNNIKKEYSVTGYEGTATDVTIAETYNNLPITSIGSSAFSGCSSLTSITIPDSVTSIGSSAFSGCSSLSGIIIPDSVTSIGGSAFYNCSILNDVIIPNSVTTIGENAFYGCPCVEVSDDLVFYVGKWVVDCDENTTLATIKDDTIGITSGAFRYCKNITSLTVPNNVKYIGAYAFAECSGLQEIVLGNSITSIGYVFSKCSNLTSITIPNGVLTIPNNIFSDCTKLNIINYQGTINQWVQIEGLQYLMSCNTNEKNLYISDESIKDIELSSVNAINPYSFYKCSSLTSVVISDDVISIGDKAFYGCKKLKNITTGNGLTSIGEELFTNCTSLTQIIIGNSVSVIEKKAFYNCKSLNEITIPESVISIGTQAFYYCTGLTSITFGENSKLTTIETEAFYYCTGLTSITIPDSVISIGYGTLSACNKLTTLTIPFVGATLNEKENAYMGYIFGRSYNSTNNPLPYSLQTITITGGTTIESRAFYCCSSLKKIIIPDSVISIGAEAFAGYMSGDNSHVYIYMSLTDVVIGNSVTSIGNSAFRWCRDLANVYYTGTVSEWASKIDGLNHIMAEGSDKTLYFNDESIKDAVLENITEINPYTFYNCSSLTSITIPDSVTNIGNRAFYNCSGLTSITIPDSVTNIGSFAFYNCSSLTSITFGENSQLISIGAHAFFKCSALGEITIPKGVIKIDNYAFAGGDSGYANWQDKVVNMSLTKVIIESSKISIGEYAFFYCKNLLNITFIENSVTSIGRSAFEGCSSLTSVTIPNSVTSIGEWAFDGCSTLTSINFNGTTAQWNAISKGGGWNYDVPATQVVCTDETIDL